MRLVRFPVTDSPVTPGVDRVEAELTRGSDWNMILRLLACPIQNRLALMPCGNAGASAWDSPTPS